MIKNGQTQPKLAINGLNIAQNHQKLAKHGQKLPEIGQNDQKCLKIDKHGTSEQNSGQDA